MNLTHGGGDGAVSVAGGVRNENYTRYEVLPRILSQNPDTAKALLQPMENRISVAPRPIELFKVNVQLEVIVYPF